MSFTPTLEQLLDQAIDSALIDMHTCMPGIVESYDATKQTVNVRPAIKRKYDDGTLVERPLIPDVPVYFPKGGGFSITHPIKKNDDVLLIFSERSLERWKNEAGVVDPRDSRKFHLSDAFCFPTGGRDINTIPGAKENLLRIVNDKGEIQIDENGEIIVKSTGQRIFLKNDNCSVELQASGLVELKNAVGKIRITDAGKFKIEGAKELLTILDGLISALLSAQTLTALGPQNFLPSTLITLTNLKADLATIKE